MDITQSFGLCVLGSNPSKGIEKILAPLETSLLKLDLMGCKIYGKFISF